MKILILGSMSFASEMAEVGKQIEKIGHEVKMPEFIDNYLKLKSSEEMHNAAVKNKMNYDLYTTYYNLIKDNDAILIINNKKKGVKNYIGANALIEMAYAHILGKKIYLLNSIPEMPYTDEIKAMNITLLNGDLNKLNTSNENAM
jgi:hypothetical protein